MPMQFPINWSSVPSNPYNSHSDPGLLRRRHAYKCSLTRIDVLNENKSNAIRGAGTASSVEILPNDYDSFSQQHRIFL